MQLCNRIYYSTVHWRLNVFRAAYRSSSGALTVFASSGLRTHVVTGRSQVWVGIPTQTWLQPVTTCVLKPEAANTVRGPMMSGMPLETRWAFNERWNNKFYYKVASCWLFLLMHTTMHRSMNIKFTQVTMLGLVGGNFCSAYTASHNETPALNKHHLSVFIVVRPAIISVSQ